MNTSLCEYVNIKNMSWLRYKNNKNKVMFFFFISIREA